MKLYFDVKLLLIFAITTVTIVLSQHLPEFTALLFIIGGLLLWLVGKAGHYEKPNQ